MPDAATAASADPPSEATALPLSSGSGYDHPDLSPDEFQPEDSPAVLSTIPSNVHSSGPERGWKPSDCCRKENSPSHITGYPARQPDHNPVKPMVGSKKRHIGLRKVQHNAPLFFSRRHDCRCIPPVVLHCNRCDPDLHSSVQFRTFCALEQVWDQPVGHSQCSCHDDSSRCAIAR